MNILGVDEAGRGPWAGPLVAAAVICDADIGVADSKKLSGARRAVLLNEIKCKSAAIGIGWVSPRFIDRYGLNKANAMAMSIAVAQIKLPYSKVIIDGNINFLPDIPEAEALIKADSLVPCVSAASIVAKQFRDNYMKLMSKIYPVYGFDRHMGYGTKFHIGKLEDYGVSPIHRLSYKPVKAFIYA